MDPKRILIIGNYGAGNLGDDAILGGILTDLQAIGYKGAIDITHGGFDSSPEIYRKRNKVPFVPSGLRSRMNWAKLREVKSIIKKADLVILGGGGLFSDAESWKAPMIWEAQAHMCRKLGTPYICYGQSLGPLNRRLSKLYVKRCFSGARASHFRDKVSVKTLNSFKLKSTFGTDCAFSWLSTLKEENKGPKKLDILAINFRLWPGCRIEDWMAWLEPIVDFATQTKLKPILISMDVSNEKELTAMKATGLEIFEAPSAKMAFEAFQKAKLSVCMRLHANIFSLAAGTPTVTLSYSDKVENLFNDLSATNEGLECIDLKHINELKLKNALKSVKGKKVRLDLRKPLAENQAFLSHALWE